VSRGQIRFLLAAAQRALEIAAAVSHNVWPEGSVAEGSCAQGGARTIPNRSTVRTLLRLVCDTAAVRRMHQDRRHRGDTVTPGSDLSKLLRCNGMRISITIQNCVRSHFPARFLPLTAGFTALGGLGTGEPSSGGLVDLGDLGRTTRSGFGGIVLAILMTSSGRVPGRSRSRDGSVNTSARRGRSPRTKPGCRL
jgi:hypothetical protein